MTEIRQRLLEQYRQYPQGVLSLPRREFETLVEELFPLERFESPHVPETHILLPLPGKAPSLWPPVILLDETPHD